MARLDVSVWLFLRALALGIGQLGQCLGLLSGICQLLEVGSTRVNVASLVQLVQDLLEA